MRRGAADPGGFAALVADLVWSTQPRVAAGNSARLAKLAPELLEKLRHGLATIDYPAPRHAALPRPCGAAHQQALKAAEQPGRPVPLSTSMTREELEAMLGPDEDTGRGRGSARPKRSTRASCRRTSRSRPSRCSRKRQPRRERHAAGVARARRDRRGAAAGRVGGDAVDGGWARYQVTWASPHGTLFMFANAAGKTHSMTRRLLDKMLQAGTLRMISGQAVVDGALDAVAQTALRNSLDVRL